MRLVRDLETVLHTEANRKLREKLGTFLTQRGITDIDLLKVFGICMHLSEERDGEIPEVFELGVDIGSWDFDSISSVFLAPFSSDPRVFIRFATPMIVKDFQSFYKLCRQAGFPLTERFESLVAAVISVYESHLLPQEEAFEFVVDKMSEFDSDIHLTSAIYRELCQSMKAFRYAVEYPSDGKTEEAFGAIRILSHDLDKNYSKRLQSCIDFYLGVSRSGEEARLRSKKDGDAGQFTRFEPNRGDVKGNRLKEAEEKNLWNESRKHLNKADPIDILWADHLLKTCKWKDVDTSSYRKTDDGITSGLIFDIFTGMMDVTNPGTRAVIFFPSPEFVRSVYDDRWLEMFGQILFVVESDEEKDLLDIQFGKCNQQKKGSRSNIYPERPNLLVSTLYDFMSNVKNTTKQIPFPLAMVFSSGMEVRAENTSLGELGELFNEYPGISEILCFGDDAAFSREDSFASAVARGNSFDVDSLVFLPQSLPTIGNLKKKSLWYAKKNDESGKKEIFDWTELSFTDDILYYDSEEIVPDCNARYITAPKNKNIRSSLKENRKTIEERSSVKPFATREKAGTVDFTENEIRIYYTYSEVGAGKFRAHAYVKCGQPPREVEQSRGSTDVYGSPEDVRNWAKNVYPYKTKLVEPDNAENMRASGIRFRKDKVEIRPIIAKEYREELREKPVCLKTLVYINPELEMEFDEEKTLLLKVLVKEFGGDKLSELDPETMVDRLGKLGMSESEILKAMVLLCSYFDEAVKNGNIKDNSVADMLVDNRRRSRVFSNIRSIMAIKSLTKEQLRSIFQFIDKRIQENKIIYAGVLIRLICGLETSAVCGLRWSDFVEVPRFGFYQLHVYEKLSTNKKDLLVFENPEDFRCIPCSEILADELKGLKQRLIDAGKYNEEDFILSDGTSEFPPDPTILNKAVRKAINHLKIKGNIMSIDEDTSTDFSKYMGDFLRENFRYNAHVIGRMNADEVAYFLANKPETTFACSYCDYSRDSSQLILQTKLRRIDSVLKGEERKENEGAPSLEIGNDWTDIPPVGNCPTRINIMASPDTEVDYRIELKSDFGVYAKIEEG